jgi:hypothetical protein
MKKLTPPVKDYAIVALDPAERDRLKALNQIVIHNKGKRCFTSRGGQ